MSPRFLELPFSKEEKEELPSLGNSMCTLTSAGPDTVNTEQMCEQMGKLQLEKEVSLFV